MKCKLPGIAVVAVGLLVVASPLFAHHAGSLYDRDHTITLSGTVTEYSFNNPHTKIVFDVTDDQGNATSWVAESAPPQRMYRAGWTRNTLKVGDKISVTGNPLKDGRREMSVRKLTGPDGHVLSEGAE